MYKEYRLKSIPNGNCRVCLFYDENSILQRIELESYLTTVVVIDLSPYMPVLYTTYDWKVFCEYRKMYKKSPRTSINHICKFTKEFTGENLYHELKKSDIILLSPEQVETIIETVVNNYI